MSTSDSKTNVIEKLINDHNVETNSYASVSAHLTTLDFMSKDGTHSVNVEKVTKSLLDDLVSIKKKIKSITIRPYVFSEKGWFGTNYYTSLKFDEICFDSYEIYDGALILTYQSMKIVIDIYNTLYSSGKYDDKCKRFLDILAENCKTVFTDCVINKLIISGNTTIYPRNMRQFPIKKYIDHYRAILSCATINSISMKGDLLEQLHDKITSMSIQDLEIHYDSKSNDKYLNKLNNCDISLIFGQRSQNMPQNITGNLKELQLTNPPVDFIDRIFEGIKGPVETIIINLENPKKYIHKCFDKIIAHYDSNFIFNIKIEDKKKLSAFVKHMEKYCDTKRISIIEHSN